MRGFLYLVRGAAKSALLLLRAGAVAEMSTAYTRSLLQAPGAEHGILGGLKFRAHPQVLHAIYLAQPHKRAIFTYKRTANVRCTFMEPRWAHRSESSEKKAVNG